MLKALFQKIKSGLSKTRSVFAGIVDLFRGRGRVDKAFLDELERRLYLADVGGYAVALIVDRVRKAFIDKEISGEVEAFVKCNCERCWRTLRKEFDTLPAGQQS